ncbi:reverse transcriptase domain-containing protein [Microcoleus sp. Pol7_A1]|uniref:reverse transcriptase domain-containing protein n=1 Tax=Microcoleus sp. Pol7_A1 TaxID=2818893 RepID=UPI002FD035D6
MTSDSIHWAIKFVHNHSDGDLFPKILEVDAIHEMADDFVKLIEGKDLVSFPPGSCRRFIVPKDEIAYRQATQLYPQDSIILAALIYQYGQGIEDRRLSTTKVFSYRFQPDIKFGLYASQTAWNDFWETASQKSREFETILYCDVADFYNQIYHHVIENQLIASGFPNQAMKWIISLLESTTAGVSRGVPVGPHSVHLIAECAMIPIDNTLSSNGIKFIRFADDFVIFCDSPALAKKTLASLASTLDKQQRLMLQRHKTKIYDAGEFGNFCRSMVEDRPISSDEDKVLKTIRKYSGGNPYAIVSYNEVSHEDWKTISGDIIRTIIQEYIEKSEVDYIRLRWFYRRLTQIGHPDAIDISLEQIANLGPCFANICTYLASVQSMEKERWIQVGEKLLDLLESDEVQSNEYFRLSILSLFTKNKYINHFSNLAGRYSSSDQFVRREILLSAKENLAFDWLREHKESYQMMDTWQQIAYIYGCSGFPKDEKKFFLNMCTFRRPFEQVLAKWAKKA